MGALLNSINSPDDLKKLSQASLNQLSCEIREFLIEKISKTGGHLASNLGVCELTIALHRSFSVPYDKIVWDVGHQSYVHKIICGRKDEFDNLRKLGGISGFPKVTESACDVFNTGHSSTSLSVALGLAVARDLDGEKNHVIAMVGDASFTGGPSLEALNHISHSGKKVIIILNDNQMSIEKNTGGFAHYLNRIATTPSYYNAKRETKELLDKIPLIGNNIAKVVSAAKKYIKYIISPGVVFEELGYKYLGPINGHDISALCQIFEEAKKLPDPVVVHVCTTKGKGYPSAESAPSKYHAISRGAKPSSRSFSTVFGEEMVSLAEKEPKLVSISPSMPMSCGLTDFIKKYPKRFYDTGIAEAHAVIFAAGLAAGGYIPVVSIYSSFLQRAYDSMIHDVAISSLHVVFAVDRAGIVGEDGETHQGIYDLSFLSSIPNMTILAPADFIELADMLNYAVLKHNAPIAIRYPRGGAEDIKATPFEFAKAVVLKEGVDVTIVAVGKMVHTALKAAEILESHGISAEVINPRTVKPLDTKVILNSALKTGLVVSLEDNTERGGVGSIIGAALSLEQINVPFMLKAFPDKFIPHGTIEELMEIYGLDAVNIANDIEKRLKLEKTT